MLPSTTVTASKFKLQSAAHADYCHCHIRRGKPQTARGLDQSAELLQSGVLVHHLHCTRASHDKHISDTGHLTPFPPSNCTFLTQSKNPQPPPAFCRVVNAPYLAGPGFESRTGDRLSWLRFPRVSSVPPDESLDSAFQLGHHRFLPNRFQCIIHLSTLHSTLIV
jgi:hypothetical protein